MSLKLVNKDVCNEKTFDAVYREYGKTLYNYIYYKTGEKNSSEDIVQESFVKLWQNCKKVKIYTVGPYLFQIAKNLFLNSTKRKALELNIQNTSDSSVDKVDAQYLMEKDEFEKRLMSAINNLTEAQKEVFLLNRIDGKTYKEIATMLGVSQKAVEKRMHKALIKLREIYDKI